jgi:N-acyl-D-aspartate/D-glutamate deacylase
MPPGDRDTLIHLMETVEDIGFEDLSKGLHWNWETYPQYLDALAARRYNMDIGTLLPHSTMRAYVMGEAALERAADDTERAGLTDLARQAVAAGALGFGTSTLRDQRTKNGRYIPSVMADEAEFAAIASGMSHGGGGVFQVAIEFNQFPLACEELEMFARVGEASGRPIMYSCKQTNRVPQGWRDLLAISDAANARGIAMHPQVLGRPTGAIMGLQTTLHPFSRCPSWRPLAGFSLVEKVAAMRDPSVRVTLLAELEQAQQKLPERLRGFELVFPLGDDPDYEPAQSASVEAIARAKGVASGELVYDLLLEKEGRQLLLLAGGNYAEFSLEPSLEMIRNPHSVPGLGDAGAHAGIICDASISTYMLSYWTRDRRRGDRLELPQVVKWLTADCASVLGLTDRGRIAPGLKADLNVIDHDQIRLHAPRATHDLPAGGTRLVQDATGYVATVVSGKIVHRHDQPTQALPGRLVRRGHPLN